MLDLIINLNLLRRISPRALALLALVIVVFSIAFISWVEDKKIWGFAFGASIGVGGLMFNNAVKLYAESTDRTLKEMLAIQERESGNVLEGSITYLRAIGGLNEQRAITLFRSKEAAEVTQVEGIIATMNELERIAVTSKYNPLNDEMLYDFMAGATIEYYNLVSDALPYLRGQTNAPSPFTATLNPRIFSQFEQLAMRWERKSRRLHW